MTGSKVIVKVVGDYRRDDVEDSMAPFEAK